MMKGKRYTTEDKIRILREADRGKSILEVCRAHNISEDADLVLGRVSLAFHGVWVLAWEGPRLTHRPDRKSEVTSP